MSKNIKINNTEYTNIQEFGNGRQSTTSTAENNGHKYVIKRYKISSAEKLKRANREIEILKKISGQPCFPQYVESSILDDGKKIGIVMSFVAEKTLGDYLKENNPDIKERLDIYKKILDAVARFHQCDFYHRDLKPDNILIKDDGQVVIVDFGLSINANTEEHAISLLDNRVGPLFFQCPESEVVSSEFENIPGVRFDLYPLGKLLYYLIKFNNDNHGYFPREKNAESPWRLTGNECLFQPVIASVVTETPESATVKSIDELIEIFDKYHKIYLQNPKNEEAGLGQDLTTMILTDENVHKKLSSDAKEKIFIENAQFARKIVQDTIQSTLNKIITSSTPNAFTISNNIATNSLLLMAQHSFPSEVSKISIDFQIKYLNNSTLGLSLMVVKDKNIDLKQNICLKLLIFIDCNQLKVQPFIYNKVLNVTNSTTLSKEDIKTNIESWITGLDSLIENLIKENYKNWKELYEKNL